MISHQKFTGDLDPVTKKLTNIRLIGQPQLYNLDEKGWKDTHIVPAGEVTRVIAKFDRPGKYVWHCHILSHEDHDMMRPFMVSETGDAGVTSKATPAASIAADQLQWTISPNPFNSDVTIGLNLPGAKKVSITLYDEKGRLVKQIYSGNHTAGFKQWTINGSNMASGVYFCEIMVNNRKFLRKLVLQK